MLEVTGGFRPSIMPVSFEAFLIRLSSIFEVVPIPFPDPKVLK
jgi:hypothetical protein